MEFDIVVVGCGVAGLSAAVSAAENGMKVCLLERSEKEVRGGNSRYTEAYLRIKSETEISDDFEERLALNSIGVIDPSLLNHAVKNYKEWPSILKSYGFTDPELISSFADGVPETIAWLKYYKVTFLEVNPFATQEVIAKRMTPSGGGLAIVEALTEAAEQLGVTFLYETTALDLLLSQDGHIEGIKCSSSNANISEINAKAVILACGGFQGNQEMMSRYVGKHSYFTRPVALGGIYNKGEGIKMALKIGAAPAGQYDLFHAEPIDPRSGLPEALVAVFIYGILVNKDAKRFVDEGSNYYEFIYEDVSREIMLQKGGEAYLIFDRKLEEVPRYEIRVKTDRSQFKAKSVHDLAIQIGLDPLQLEKTIDEYNNAVQDGAYNPATLDGKCTKGIFPKKSNWARKIDKNDIMAFPIICANCFTFGGLKVSADAEVINNDGIIIPGLYAAGEVVGFYYGSYVGSTSVLKGLVFGRKAGIASAKWLKN